jgi:hypothetical protein
MNPGDRLPILDPNQESPGANHLLKRSARLFQRRRHNLKASSCLRSCISNPHRAAI